MTKPPTWWEIARRYQILYALDAIKRNDLKVAIYYLADIQGQDELLRGENLSVTATNQEVRTQ